MHSFVNFSELVGSLLSSHFIFICYSFVGIICIILGLVYAHGSYTLAFVVLLVLCILNTVVSLILSLCTMNSVFSRQFGSFHFLSMSFMIGFWLFYRSDAGMCSVTPNAIQVLSCNPLSSAHSLPTDTLLYAMLTPIVYLITCPKVSCEDLVKSWVTVLLWISFCLIAFNAYNTLFSFLLYVPLSALIMFKLKNDQYSLRLQSYCYESKIEELEAKSQCRDREIQNMLSNVAHDMKTVINFILNFYNFSNSFTTILNASLANV